MHAHTITSGLYSPNLFRLAIHPQPADRFPPLVSGESLPSCEKVTVHRDLQGMLRSQKKSFRFIFDPPTGNFRISRGQTDLVNGAMQTGKFSQPGLYLRLLEGDRIYGFGAASGSYDRMGQQFRLLNVDTQGYSVKGGSYSSFPFFWIRRNDNFIAIFINIALPLDVSIDDGRKGVAPSLRIEVDSVGKPVTLDLFVMTGTAPEILAAYSSITGYPFLPPIWALGFHQSRWSYKSAARLLEIADQFRSNDLPCDALYLDIDYMQRYKLFTWNEESFPEPTALMRKLQDNGFRTVAIVDPGLAVVEEYLPYLEARDQGYLLKDQRGEPFVGRVWPGRTVFPDFSRAEVREWWARKHEALLGVGVSGIWNDMNEPALRIGSTADPLAEELYGEAGSQREWRNLYANFEAQATSEAFRLFRPDERPFILTRSGHSGIQRYAAIWTGDNHANWEHLRQNLHMVLNLGLSGQPFSGADVGGFSAGPGLLGTVKIRRNPELYLRWMELGSLMPFFRAHSTRLSFDHEPWSYGEEILALVRKQIRRRYYLLPYLYTLACQSHLTGEPLVRPLFYHYPGHRFDPQSESQLFMVGPSLLVAPVLEAGQSERRVELPPGGWYEFESGRLYAGGESHTFAVAPGYYPLFVRAGTLLPCCREIGRNALESILSGVHFELYPDTRLEGELQLDDGLSSADAGSNGMTISFEGKRERAGDLQLTLVLQKRGYSPEYKSMELLTSHHYHTLQQRGKQQLAATPFTRSEGRSFLCHSFSLPLQNGKFELLYDSSSGVEGELHPT